MSYPPRVLVAGVLLSMLAACAAPRHVHHARARTPREVADTRLRQVDGRIENLSHRVDKHVSDGHYPAPQGDALHHRLDVIHGEAHDMAGNHGGVLTPDEQRLLNEELDTAAHAIE